MKFIILSIVALIAFENAFAAQAEKAGKKDNKKAPHLLPLPNDAINVDKKEKSSDQNKDDDVQKSRWVPQKDLQKTGADTKSSATEKGPFVGICTDKMGKTFHDGDDGYVQCVKDIAAQKDKQRPSFENSDAKTKKSDKPNEVGVQFKIGK